MNPIDAEYDDGVLRPARRLALQPGERVSLIVLRRADPARWDLKRLAAHADEDAALAAEGLAAWDESLDREDGPR